MKLTNISGGSLRLALSPRMFLELANSESKEIDLGADTEALKAALVQAEAGKIRIADSGIPALLPVNNFGRHIIVILGDGTDVPEEDDTLELFGVTIEFGDTVVAPNVAVGLEAAMTDLGASLVDAINDNATLSALGVVARDVANCDPVLATDLQSAVLIDLSGVDPNLDAGLATSGDYHSATEYAAVEKQYRPVVLEHTITAGEAAGTSPIVLATGLKSVLAATNIALRHTSSGADTFLAIPACQIRLAASLLSVRLNAAGSPDLAAGDILTITLLGY